MRAHTITTKAVGGRSPTKRTVVPGAIIALAAALLVWMVVPGSAAAHGTHLKATMAGSKVIGQAGAPTGVGTAKLHLLPTSKPVERPGLQRVCFTIEYSGIGTGIETWKGLKAYVFRGKSEEPAPRWPRGGLRLVHPGIDIEHPSEKKSPIDDCTESLGYFDHQGNPKGAIPRRLLMKMTRRPRRYQVQVVTKEYPDGAIRGRLKKARAQTGTAASEGVVSYRKEVTKVTIFKDGALLHGFVNSKVRACRLGREVIVFSRLPGPDLKLGATLSGPRHAPWFFQNWFVDVEGVRRTTPLGRVYAKVTREVHEPGEGERWDAFVCRAAYSFAIKDGVLAPYLRD